MLKPPESDPAGEDDRDGEGLGGRLWRYVHAKFPTLIPRPGYRPNLKIRRRHDDEENAETSPPDDEAIDLHCVWAAEVYTPSLVDQLVARISALGWDRGGSSWMTADLGAWIRRSREAPYGGSWHNLGIIARPGEGPFIGDYLPAPLPESITYARGGMFTLTPSITCIVLAFVIDDQHSRQYDEVLRRRYETTVEQHGRGFRELSPDVRKREAIVELRSKLRAGIAAWFHAHLPGLFASGLLDGEFPTCEFVTVRKGRPFPKRDDRASMEPVYMRLLEIAHGFSAWEARKTRGLRFAWPLTWSEALRFHAVIAANEGEIDANELRPYGGPDRSAYSRYVDDRVQALISRWALIPLISGLEHHLSAVRDSASFAAAPRENALALFDTLRNRIHQSVDITAVAAELRQFGDDKPSFDHDVEDYQPVDPGPASDPAITLTGALRREIVERAGRLEDSDRSVRELMVQYGAVVAARENLRLQRTMGRLTWVLVVLTIVIAFLTLLLAWDLIVTLTNRY